MLTKEEIDEIEMLSLATIRDDAYNIRAILIAHIREQDAELAAHPAPKETK